MSGLRVLAVDDEALALSELTYLLRGSARVAVVASAQDGVETLKLLRNQTFDAVFLDVSMPGLDGVEVAEIVRRLPQPPEVVFVTAHEGRASQAFGLDAVDYVLKPVSAARLEDTIRKLVERLAIRSHSSELDPEPEDAAVLPVDTGGGTRFVHRRDVLYAEAHGDYVRVRTVGREVGLHTARVSLSALEQRWGGDGFLRIHRSYLVALHAVTELRKDPLGGQLVRVGGDDLPVSRRQSKELRERLRILAAAGR